MSILYEMRCDACGDSAKHTWKKHAVVFDSGISYCIRCGHSKTLPLAAIVSIALNEVTVEEAIGMDWESDKTISCSRRPTLLDVYAGVDTPNYMSFQMRSVNGVVLGYHNRDRHSKKFYNEGKRGFGYVGDTVQSTPDKPIVLVEGPFDVIDDHYVCVFGTLNKSVLKTLRLQYVILWPDPDCLDTRLKRMKFEQMARELRDEQLLFIQGYYSSDADPDEYTKREYISL